MRVPTLFLVLAGAGAMACERGPEPGASVPRRYIKDMQPWKQHREGTRSEYLDFEITWRTVEKLMTDYRARGRGWSWQEFVSERSEFYTLPPEMMFLAPPEGGEKAYAVMYFGRHDRILPVEVVDLSGRVATVTIPEDVRDWLKACWWSLTRNPTPENATNLAVVYRDRIKILVDAIADADWQPASERMPQWLEYVEVDGHQVYKCDGSDCKPQPWVGGDRFDRHRGPK